MDVNGLLDVEEEVDGRTSTPRTSTPRPMFAGPDVMKEKLREMMVRPKYDVCNFYKTTGFCQLVARSQKFEYTTLSVIALNALWIAIDTDLNGAAMLLDAHPVFQFAEHFFCAYFTFEWTMRFGAFQRKRNGLRDAWFVFDSFMVFMMVGETWVMTIVLLATGSGGGSGGMGNASILRLLRLLRLSRMARMAKLLRSMPELLILIKGMVSAMKSLFFTMLLLLILIYLFAIMFRQLTDGSEVGIRYFGDMITAMHTLMLDGTFLDGVGSVMKALEKESIVYVLLFYLFILLSALTVMNMLIGVLCEVVSAVASLEREQIAVGMVKDGFMDIIAKGGLDTDGDTKISRTEFEAILDNPSATKLLESVAVDVYALVDLADFIFAKDEDANGKNQDDRDQDGGKQLSFGEFMDVVLSLRGTNQATVKDVVDLRRFIRGSLYCLEERIRERSRPCSPEVRRKPPHPPAQEPPAGTEPAPPAPAWRELAGHGRVGDEDKRDGQEAKHKLLSEPHWIRTVRLEGVLTATNAEVQGFLDSLSVASARSSQPLTGRSSIEGTVASDAISGFVSASLTPSTAPSRGHKCPPRQQQGPHPERARDLAELQERLARLGQVLFDGVRDLQGFRDVA